jgi:hypothetical protein
MCWRRSGLSVFKTSVAILSGRGFILSFLLVGCLFWFPARLHAEQISVIVAKESVLSHLSKAEIRGIYLGEIRFMEGMPIRPLQYPEGNIKDAFLSGVVGLSSKDYKLYWVKKIFQDGLTPPMVKADPSEIINLIGQDQWGIGYIPKEMADEMTRVQIIYSTERVRH